MATAPRQPLLFHVKRYCWLKPGMPESAKEVFKRGNTDHEKIVIILHDYAHGRNGVRDVICYGFHSFVPDDFIHHYAACHNFRVLWNSSHGNQ
jgi:hypothetical protein